jgi:hypothetical protein
MNETVGIALNGVLIKSSVNSTGYDVLYPKANKAKELVGMKYYDLPTKFHHIKFPKYHNDSYEDLREILQKVYSL